MLKTRFMEPHSSTLSWKIPWTEEPSGLQSMGSLRVGHDWTTSLSLFTFMHRRRKCLTQSQTRLTRLSSSSSKDKVTKSLLTLRTHELQHSRLLCLPLSPGVCSDSCPLSEWGLTGLILQFKGLSKVFSSTIWKFQFFCAQPFLWANSHFHTWLLEKSVFTVQKFVSKVMSMLSNTLSRFVLAFLPRSKCLSILWL